MELNSDAVGGAVLRDALENTAGSYGLLRIQVGGRFGRFYRGLGSLQDPPVLRISRVRSVEWLPMTETKFHELMDRRH